MMDDDQISGLDLRTNPARPRMLSRARRGAFLMMVAVIAACCVATGAAALAVGRPRLASGELGAFTVGIVAAQVTVLLVMVGVARWLSRRSTRALESLFRQQDQLIRAVAHEVRSPLGRARTAIDEGESGLREPAEALVAAAGFVDDTDVLVGDLLETARVMTGSTPMAADAVRLDEVVAEAARTVTGRSTIELDLRPVVVSGSARLLRRAVSNLVRNAALHGYADGPGTITVRVDDDGVTVLDDGPGVAEDRLVELRYETPLTVSQKGPGLGLYLCGWIAEVHGGRLVLANRPEGGFSAGLALPAWSPPPG